MTSIKEKKRKRLREEPENTTQTDQFRAYQLKLRNVQRKKEMKGEITGGKKEETMMKGISRELEKPHGRKKKKKTEDGVTEGGGGGDTHTHTHTHTHTTPTEVGSNKPFFFSLTTRLNL